MLIYLPPEELILQLHDAILEISGGRPGVRDANVIHAAVNRPKTYLAYHDDCDLHTVCAVILDAIARNHAFVEGNKRTGLMSALLTYELNGITLQKSADRDSEFEDLVLWVVLNKPEITEVAEKLKSLSTKYQVNSMSKFISKLRDTITPYGSED